MNIIAGIVVVIFGLGLIGFAVLAAVNRQFAESFLNQFAKSAQAHYIEQFLRLVVGTAILIFSDKMWYSLLFLIFGWIIVITTVGLLLIQWQWHRQFAEKVIPLVIRFLKFYAVASLALGVFIIYSASRYFSQ